MNREIKFRIWDTIDKKFEILNVAWPVSIGVATSIIYNHPHRRIVQQFAGLKDKNEKEIWEGDILKCREIWVCSKWENPIWHKGIVVYRAPCFDIDSDSPRVTFEDGEVLGNIFENPELLK